MTLVSFTTPADIIATVLANDGVGSGLDADLHKGVDRDLGKLLQYVTQQIGTTVTTSVAIPLDGTIPQNTEGGQVLSFSFTPVRTDSKILIRGKAFISCSSNNQVALALFTSESANAKSVSVMGAEDNNSRTIVVEVEVPSWSGARTISMRFGADAAVSTFVNRDPSGNTYGGIPATNLTVMEIAT